MKQPFLSKKKNVVITAVFYTFLWGSAFPLVKLCMEQFGIDQFDQVSKCLVAGLRFFISGVVILSLMGKKRQCFKSIRKVDYMWIILYGLFATTVQYAFTYIGLSNMDASKGAIFDQLCVFFIIIVGGIFCKDDSLSLKKVLGCIVGFVGVFLTSASGISFDFSMGGEGMMILAGISQTFAYLLAKRCSQTVNALPFVGIAQTVGGFILCVFSLALGGGIYRVTLFGVIILLLLAGISSGAYVLSLLPLRYFPATEIASFNLLIPVFGVVMSGIVLGENVLRTDYLFALLLIAVGIFVINYSFKKKGKRL